VSVTIFLSILQVTGTSSSMHITFSILPLTLILDPIGTGSQTSDPTTSFLVIFWIEFKLKVV